VLGLDVSFRRQSSCRVVVTRAAASAVSVVHLKKARRSRAREPAEKPVANAAHVAPLGPDLSRKPFRFNRLTLDVGSGGVSI
jgi:hypothetical protein